MPFDDEVNVDKVFKIVKFVSEQYSIESQLKYVNEIKNKISIRNSRKNKNKICTVTNTVKITEYNRELRNRILKKYCITFM